MISDRLTVIIVIVIFIIYIVVVVIWSSENVRATFNHSLQHQNVHKDRAQEAGI